MTEQNLRMQEELDHRGYTSTVPERLDARRHAALTLTDRCTIRTCTVTDTATGGQTETWADTYKAVPCRLSGASGAFGFGDERVFAGRLVQQADYLLLVPYAQALTSTNRVADVVGPDGVSRDAGPFEVLAVGKVLSVRDLTQALLRRVT